MTKVGKYEINCPREHLIGKIKYGVDNYKSPYLSFYFKEGDNCFLLIPIFKMSMNVFYNKPIPLYIYPIFTGAIINNEKDITLNVQIKWSTSLRLLTSIIYISLILNFIGGGLSGLVQTLTGKGAIVLPIFIIVLVAIYQIKRSATKRFIDSMVILKEI